MRKVDIPVIMSEMSLVQGVSESVCGGSTRYITPRQARNKKGVMMYIVNQPDNRTELTQLVKITVCHREGDKCQVGGFGR